MFSLYTFTLNFYSHIEYSTRESAALQQVANVMFGAMD